MTTQRDSRHEAIRSIVRSKHIRTQQALANELQALGFTCTQATISRDIADMGLCKAPDSTYALAEDLHLTHMIKEFVSDICYAKNLIVVKSQPGTAAGVAAAIDNAHLSYMIGSVAGDDTVLVIASDDSHAAELVEYLKNLRTGRS